MHPLKSYNFKTIEITFTAKYYMFFLQTPYSLCRHPTLLCLSHKLLLKCRQELRQTALSDQLVASCLCWLLRCFFIQQKLLGQRSATLWEKISEVAQELQKFLESKLLSE